MSINKLVIKKIVSAVGRGDIDVYKSGNCAEISGSIDVNAWRIEVCAERKTSTLMGVMFELHAQKFNEAGFMIESIMIESFESYNFSSLEHSVKKCIYALQSPSDYISHATLLPSRKCADCCYFRCGKCGISDLSVDDDSNCLIFKRA